MRILVAPDKFAGTLTAVQAAQAVAAGWRRQAPDDELDLAPMSDGGPGFVDVLHAALGGDLLAVTVRGPRAEQVPGTVLRVGDTAYVESAQACGIHLTGGAWEDATTLGVGDLVAAAVDSGARRVVVGLGGSGTNDGGAGLLCALGAGADADLDRGPAGLAGITTVDLAAARARVAGVELVAASDVDNPLTGLFGATKVFGPQKGVPEDRLVGVDAWLEAFAAATDRRLSLGKGAGRPAAWASRCCSSAAPVSPGSAWSPRLWGCPSGPARPTSWSPARAPSTSAVAPARSRTAWARSRPRRCARAWCSPARCSSGPGRCGPSAWSRRTRWWTWWGRSARWPSPPPPSSSSPPGWPAPGRAETPWTSLRPSRGGRFFGGPARNIRVCATIEEVPTLCLSIWELHT